VHEVPPRLYSWGDLMRRSVAKTKVASDGTYLFDHTLPRGTSVLHAAEAAGHGNIAGNSPTVKVTVS
jgi:hypothetical protein